MLVYWIRLISRATLCSLTLSFLWGCGNGVPYAQGGWWGSYEWITVILLVLIGVGVLLLSEEGKAVLASIVMGLAIIVGLAITLLVILVILGLIWWAWTTFGILIPKWEN